MLLSSISNISDGVQIIKDDYFDTLGLTSNKYIDERVLVFLNDLKYLHEFEVNSNIACVICVKDIAKIINNKKDIGICVTANPKKLFFEFHNYLFKNTRFYGEKKANKIAKSAKIHPSANIGESNITIGKKTIIEANVTILNNVEIGENVVIRAGTVIGSEGFQFVRTSDEVIPVFSAGGVKIHDNVEIQSNTCIDKGVFKGNTEIGQYTKVDNLVHIAHDVKMGKRCMIVASSLIAGRVRIKDGVWIGASASVSNGISIGNDARISIGSVVTKDVMDNQTVTGNFAIEHKKFIEFIKTIR
ncbi:MAG: UDP-3-O-(3-hydroxymyristoyl)glucosamine N-acyltransferase [Firmicutes bacterium]|nr:UDP-3-O-(3-hydroxymyristoyl)glucosamine N-acyltransferase [Bacillota bacterium]